MAFAASVLNPLVRQHATALFDQLAALAPTKPSVDVIAQALR
jgi:hypothetical protein